MSVVVPATPKSHKNVGDGKLAIRLGGEGLKVYSKPVHVELTVDPKNVSSGRKIFDKTL
jgi:hypothetical protein